MFSGNKLVVAVLWHPAVAAAAQPAFSPWRHTDTLTGIELVAAQAYYRQFDVGGGDMVQRGQAVFQQSCQFCHGVRKVGAKFGWDFVEPTPIWSYHRPAKNLFLHVAYKPLDAAERGLMMPAMRFMSAGRRGAALALAEGGRDEADAARMPRARPRAAAAAK